MVFAFTSGSSSEKLKKATHHKNEVTEENKQEETEIKKNGKKNCYKFFREIHNYPSVVICESLSQNYSLLTRNFELMKL